MTEARRIVALAAAYDIPVIPHGSSVFSYHLQYAFSNCPMAEFLVLSPKGDKIVPLFGKLFLDEPLPKDGYIDLPDRPGEMNDWEIDNAPIVCMPFSLVPSILLPTLLLRSLGIACDTS